MKTTESNNSANKTQAKVGQFNGLGDKLSNHIRNLGGRNQDKAQGTQGQKENGGANRECKTQKESAWKEYFEASRAKNKAKLEAMSKYCSGLDCHEFNDGFLNACKAWEEGSDAGSDKKNMLFGISLLEDGLGKNVNYLCTRGLFDHIASITRKFYKDSYQKRFNLSHEDVILGHISMIMADAVTQSLLAAREVIQKTMKEMEGAPLSARFALATSHNGPVFFTHELLLNPLRGYDGKEAEDASVKMVPVTVFLSSSTTKQKEDGTDSGEDAGPVILIDYSPNVPKILLGH